jgi:hypothetical protein
MDELKLDKNYAKGSSGRKVKLIQEWLCLNGVNIATDGDFGPATDYAVRAFQKSAGLAVDGIVGDGTFARLVLPMTAALQPVTIGRKPLGAIVAAYAEQHLGQHPREIGGQNRGPWVRLYMDGNEGPAWPWCAGFASFVLKQACGSLKVPLPVNTSYSCDVLAANAQKKGSFLAGPKILDKNRITPGSLFLVQRTATDWEHTGIVVSAEKDVFHTIEGNTNDEGSREGYEVCKRIRGYEKKDFIVI